MFDFSIKKIIGPVIRKLRALLTAQPQASVSCVACEDCPGGNNVPCAVCGRTQADAAQSAHHCSNCLGVQPESCMFAQSAPVVPEGWRLVPIQPTEEMRKRAQDYLAAEGMIVSDWLVHTAYTEMLAAASAQPAAQDMVRAALSPENQRIVPVEPLIADPHPLAAAHDQGELQRLREVVGAVVSAGNGLSNITYNLAQLEGVPLSHYTCELMRMQREQWDKAVAALAASTGQEVKHDA